MTIALAYGKRYAVYDIGDGTMDWSSGQKARCFTTNTVPLRPKPMG